MTEGADTDTELSREPETDIGPTTAFEDGAASDARRFRAVAIVAGVLLVPQALAHLLIPFFVVPTFVGMYSDIGGMVPAPTSFLFALGPWLGVLLAVVDALVFWGFYRLARKYWIGLLFAPLFAMGIVSGFVVTMLYLPMFQVIQLVK